MKPGRTFIAEVRNSAHIGLHVASGYYAKPWGLSFIEAQFIDVRGEAHRLVFTGDFNSWFIPNAAGEVVIRATRKELEHT